MTSSDPKQVMIVGGGIVGLCTAYALQKLSYHITLVGPEDISDRASSAAACLIGGSAVIPWATASLWREIPSMLTNPQSPLNLAVPFPPGILSFFLKSHQAGKQKARDKSSAGLAELGLGGLDSWMRLLDDLPAASALFSQSGCYFLYTEDAHRDADKSNCHIRKSFGMTLTEHDSSQVEKLIPELFCRGATAIDVVNAAHIRDPMKLQQILKAEFLQNGGTIVETTVTDFQTKNSHVASVIAAGQSFSPDAVVIAAGYGSKTLAKKLNSDVPLLPCRGHSITLPGNLFPLDKPFLVQNNGFAVTPTDQGLRIAGLVSIGGNPARQSKRATELLLRHATSLFGNSNIDSIDPNTITYCSGVRPLTPDSLPVIDKSPYFDNVYFNFGHGHWGLTQAASSAKKLVKLIQSSTMKQENNFSISRFY